MSALALGASVPANADPSVNEINTVTPIKHVIIIVGENRSFDHLFATYMPSRGILAWQISFIECPNCSDSKRRPDRRP
jgi:phospholipase C